MAKILLVEDDNNLREIYEARLQAEGYEIVSAKDGEEALVVAKKERPDLIIADVMMPRVSGFEMLDIIRNTPELKEVHVIMLTALGQAEDKTRADSLGADRYMVKSQVTLEDIVKAASDVLAGIPANAPAAAAAAAATDTAQPAPAADATATPATAIPVSTPPATSAAPAPDVPVTQAPSVAIPVSAPPTDTATPQSQGAPTVPPQQDAVPATTVPEPSATDAQLVTDAVNDLVAGAPTVQDATATPAQPAPANPEPPTAAPAPVAPPVDLSAPQPQAPLTMEPVLTPPAPVAQPPAPAVAPPTPEPTAPPATQQPIGNGPMIGPNAAVGRKAIAPLPAGTTPGQLDLNQLLAKEGHSMEDTSGSPEFGNVPHMPGNVIAPGAADAAPPQAPTNPSQTDPNSISL